jgi:hypothetical protein
MDLQVDKLMEATSTNDAIPGAIFNFKVLESYMMCAGLHTNSITSHTGISHEIDPIQYEVFENDILEVRSR